MIGYIFMYSVFCAVFVNCIVNIGPKHPPSKGAVWPVPQYEQTQNIYFVYKIDKFRMLATNYTCPMLVRTIERYGYLMKSLNNISIRSKNLHFKRKTDSKVDVNFMGVLKELKINLVSACEDYPKFGMDESYTLWVDNTSVLMSSSIWGILRGLETWSALLYYTDDYTEIRINKTLIKDFPRYMHRGLLLDTSRHFISVSNIYKTLNAMSMNKMNVFHWHIVDDQSFPYESKKFPDLSAKGAYHPAMVYSRKDIKSVIEYARHRGIRVIPEFDVPGHTRSWGAAYPNILTECYKGKDVIGLGPMNPLRNATYRLLKKLFNEIQLLFPDKYFHIGGDEVELGCWRSNPELRKFMKNNNMKVGQLHGYFMQNVIPMLDTTSKVIVWQDVFDKIPQDKNIIVQVWRNNWVPEIVKVLRAGHKLIFSSAWYLDKLRSGGDWSALYVHDPAASVAHLFNNTDILKNIIGGEACMWGEVVNDANVISRVWPRASAVAEILWSAALPTRLFMLLDETKMRLEEHTCRMNRRGIPAQPPNGPSVCITHAHLKRFRV